MRAFHYNNNNSRQNEILSKPFTCDWNARIRRTTCIPLSQQLTRGNKPTSAHRSSSFSTAFKRFNSRARTSFARTANWASSCEQRWQSLSKLSALIVALLLSFNAFYLVSLIHSNKQKHLPANHQILFISRWSFSNYRTVCILFYIFCVFPHFRRWR